ncbi:LysR family transcriptional regulator [Erwiniaceae bacterium L1_55_4]|nr:LysR family transcriptional regulator [Erwiniaceae bacterium L1_55_4]
MNRDDLPDLAAFVLIAEKKSFTHAAMDLGVSVSSLSRAMRLLEQRLGVQLLSRTTRSVGTTAAGSRLLGQLKPSLLKIEESLQELSEEREKPSGVIKINTHRDAAGSLILPKLSEFIMSYPDIVLEIAVNDRNIDIVDAGFDAGIRHGQHVEKDMIAIQISPEYHSAVVAAPGYLRSVEKIISPHDLINKRTLAWRSPTSKSLVKWEFSCANAVYQISVTPDFISDDMQLIIGATLLGNGIAYVLRESVEKYIKDGRLVELFRDRSLLHNPCYLYYPSGKQLRPALRALISCLKYSN